MAPLFLHFLIQAKLRELGHFCYGAHTLLGPFSSVDHPTIKRRAEDALDNFAALIDQIGRVTGGAPDMLVHKGTAIIYKKSKRDILKESDEDKRSVECRWKLK